MAMAVEIIIHWRKLAKAKKANRHWHRFNKKAKPAYFHGYLQRTRVQPPKSAAEKFPRFANYNAGMIWSHNKMVRFSAVFRYTKTHR